MELTGDRLNDALAIIEYGNCVGVPWCDELLEMNDGENQCEVCGIMKDCVEWHNPSGKKYIRRGDEVRAAKNIIRTMKLEVILDE